VHHVSIPAMDSVAETSKGQLTHGGQSQLTRCNILESLAFQTQLTVFIAPGHIVTEITEYGTNMREKSQNTAVVNGKDALGTNLKQSEAVREKCSGDI